MKRKKNQKTSNVQRPTSNVEWMGRVLEESRCYGSDGPALIRSVVNEQPIFDLEDRLLEFTAQLIKLVDALPVSRAGNHVAGQLLRCGTSPFANHGEVQGAESRKDFIHKLSVCLKELREVRRWLRLIARVELLPEQRVQSLLLENEELIRIFASSIRTAERNTGR
jgi:four helix bundle protein